MTTLVQNFIYKLSLPGTCVSTRHVSQRTHHEYNEPNIYHVSIINHGHDDKHEFLCDMNEYEANDHDDASSYLNSLHIQAIEAGYELCPLTHSWE